MPILMHNDIYNNSFHSKRIIQNLNQTVCLKIVKSSLEFINFPKYIKKLSHNGKDLFFFIKIFVNALSFSLIKHYIKVDILIYN